MLTDGEYDQTQRDLLRLEEWKGKTVELLTEANREYDRTVLSLAAGGVGVHLTLLGVYGAFPENVPAILSAVVFGFQIAFCCMFLYVISSCLRNLQNDIKSYEADLHFTMLQLKPDEIELARNGQESIELVRARDELERLKSVGETLDRDSRARLWYAIVGTVVLVFVYGAFFSIGHST